MNNFCDFKRLSEANNIVVNGDINSNSDFTLDDTAPIGTNDTDWGYATLTFQTSAFGGPYMKGLSQEVTFKKNKSYIVRTTLQSGNANEVTFYILAVNGSNYETIATEAVNNETKYFTFNYTPSNYFTKLMIVCYNSGMGGVFIGRVLDINIFPVSTLFYDDCKYAPPLVKDDTIKIYTNFELDDTEIAFADLKVGLYNDGFYLYDIATLTQVVVSGDLYNVYFEWTVPVLPKGNYRFVLYEDTEITYYISNAFTYTTNTENTSIVKFRNSSNVFGYYYETATSFYNQFRVDLWSGLPTYPKQKDGYQTYEGSFIAVKTSRQKLREFQTRFFNEIGHEGFDSMLMHDEIYIDDIEYLLPEGQNYDISWSEDDGNRIGTGIVNLEEVSYSTSISQC